jgi:hypothetical protein
MASAPASATARLRGRGRSAYQNRRRAGDVDEQQSQCCEAARQDIVAFSHWIISRSLSRQLNLGTFSLGRAGNHSVQMCLSDIFNKVLSSFLDFMEKGG